MKSRHKARITEVLNGSRLDKAATECFSDSLKISRRKMRELIEQGALYLNRSRMRRLGQIVRAGDALELMLDDKSQNPNAVKLKALFELEQQHIVFEDRDLIIVNKPSGLPTQPTLDQARDCLFSAITRYLRKKDPNAYVGMHHRLDKDTSGVIFFTKSREVNAAMAKQVSEHQLQKTYLCVVSSRRANGEIIQLNNEWTCKNHLAKKNGKTMKNESVKSGGDYAETQFKVLLQNDSGILIEAKPKTGRMHQIRVHLAEMGHPILGDPIYGRKASAARLLLHAYELTLIHPKTGIALTTRAPSPENWPANLQVPI